MLLMKRLLLLLMWLTVRTPTEAVRMVLKMMMWEETGEARSG